MVGRLFVDCSVPGIKGQLFRAYAAISTAHTNPELSTEEILNKLRTSPAKQDKMIAALNLLGKFIPGIENKIAGNITQKYGLSFSDIDLRSPFGNGENIIFTYGDSANGSKFVLKINKTVVGCNLNQLIESAKIVRQEYQSIKQLFKGTGLYIPDEVTIVGHSHIKDPRNPVLGTNYNNLPTLITIQRFVPGSFEGIFENHSVDSLENRLQKKGKLWHEWAKISKAIVSQYKETGITPDIMGKDNFSINTTPDQNLRLLFIDPHMNITIDNISPEQRSIFNQRIDFLERCSIEFVK